MLYPREIPGYAYAYSEREFEGRPVKADDETGLLIAGRAVETWL